MTRQAKIFAMLAATMLLVTGATRALAADPIVESALAGGAIGEQTDGYLGFVRPPSADLKAAVDAINIKRRAGYTQIAAARNVTVDQFAQTTACNTLKSVKPGQAYRAKDGGWHVRQGSESITPDYCN
jgi:uncharacterized protein YdbL (DUF1318 family)